MKEQADKALAIGNENPALFKDIAFGRKNPPEGILPQAFEIALEHMARESGDVSTIRELGSSETVSGMATTAGQMVRMYGERDPESPVSAIREITKVREESATKRSKTGNLAKEKSDTVKQIKNEIKKVRPPKESWESFVRSLQC